MKNSKKFQNVLILFLVAIIALSSLGWNNSYYGKWPFDSSIGQKKQQEIVKLQAELEQKTNKLELDKQAFNQRKHAYEKKIAVDSALQKYALLQTELEMTKKFYAEKDSLRNLYVNDIAAIYKHNTVQDSAIISQLIKVSQVYGENSGLGLLRDPLQMKVTGFPSRIQLIAPPQNAVKRGN
jgi:hypothetical protein